MVGSANMDVPQYFMQHASFIAVTMVVLKIMAIHVNGQWCRIIGLD